MQQCRAYLCVPILSCAAFLLPSHTHLKDELGSKLLPLAIVNFNIGKGKCRPVLFNKNLQIAQGLTLSVTSPLQWPRLLMPRGWQTSALGLVSHRTPAPMKLQWAAVCCSSYTATEVTACPRTTAKHRACSIELNLG